MPVIVALFIRAAIQAIATLGLLTLAEKYLLPLLNKAIVEVAEFFGMSEEDAQALVANKFLQFAEEAGLLIITLRSKLPTKLAERLGFTTKGFSKRALSAAGAAKVAAKTGGTVTAAAAEATAAVKTAEVVAGVAKTTFSKVNDVLSFTAKAVGIPVGTLWMAAQFIDYAAWNGSAYQKTFQNILSNFGLTPDTPYPKSRVVSAEIFDKLYNTYKLEGASRINDPFKGVVVEFTRSNLVDLVDRVAARQILDLGGSTFKQVLGETQIYVVFGTSPGAPRVGTAAGVAGVAVSLPQIKVFTGIVTQGALGNVATFTPRESDLIDSVEELRAAAQNNLVPYVAALPGRIVYELAIVPSVTTASGFKQVGQVQQVVSGYDSAGRPRYKTVTNKFAVLRIFFLTKTGKRTKLDEIILGPTDAVKLQPTTTVLAVLESDVRKSIITSDVKEITTLVTSNPVTIQAATLPAVGTVVMAAAEPVVAAALTLRVPADMRLYKTYVNKRWEYAAIEWTGNVPYDYTPISQEEFESAVRVFNVSNDARFGGAVTLYDYYFALWNAGVDMGTHLTEVVKPTPQAAGPLVSGVAGGIPTTPPVVRSSAATLSQFYAEQGKALPSIAERAKLYQSFGLGPAAWYTGTAEQNNKLLAVLTGRATTTAPAAALAAKSVAAASRLTPGSAAQPPPAPSMVALPGFGPPALTVMPKIKPLKSLAELLGAPTTEF